MMSFCPGKIRKLYMIIHPTEFLLFRVYGVLVLLLTFWYTMTSPKAIPDWQSKRPFEDTNGHMLHNEVLCDVKFLVGTNKTEEIKAHKFILASRSPVFYSMFCGSLAEISNTIKIPDIEPSAFLEFLRFIYTEDCGINEESVMALLYSSKKYQIVRLTEKCMKYLNDQISTDNVCIILQQAHTFDEKELEDRCLKFVLEHGEDVLKSDGLVSVSKEVLQKIVESDNLLAEEISVYNACKRWATQQCKEKLDKQDYSPTELREQLGDLVYYIRFFTLSFDSFTKHVSTDGILTPDEMIYVFQSKAGVIEKRTSKYNFTTSAREGTQTQHIKLKRCDFDTSGCWTHGCHPDAINFTVSRRVRLLGVSLFAPKDSGTLEGQVSILDGTVTIVSKGDLKIVHGQSKYMEEVVFDRPVTVEAEKEYTIYASLKGSNAYKGTHGQQKVSAENLSVSFFKSTKSGNGTDVNNGQIPYLLFCI